MKTKHNNFKAPPILYRDEHLGLFVVLKLQWLAKNSKIIFNIYRFVNRAGALVKPGYLMQFEKNLIGALSTCFLYEEKKWVIKYETFTRQIGLIIIM